MRRHRTAWMVGSLLIAATAPAPAQHRPPVPSAPHGSHTRPVPQSPERAAPVVVVPVPPVPPPPEPFIDEADEVLHELARCLARGVTQLVDCLRDGYTSVAIRRLEACLGTESIPEEPDRVRACVAAGPWE